MISFRFHVVSITAIFLAIAIGVVVGSTYVDGAVVDGLRNRIRTVEGNVTDARDENGRLEDQLQSTREYVDLSSEYAVTDRLTDVPVFLTAARGVDEAAVERTLVLARQAGGIVPGIVWLEPRWAADGDEDLEELAVIVGGSATAAREDLWAAAWEDITDELVAGPAASDADASTLAQLEEAGFLTVDSLDDETVGLDDLIGAGPRMAIITGARAQEEVAPMIPAAVAASVDAGLVTVVGDVYVTEPEAPGRGTTLTESFDETLREAIVIVDDVDLEAGRVAVVLGMDAADDGETGRHYGYGEGADAVLPRVDPTVTLAPEGAATSVSRAAAGMGAAAAVSRAFGGVRMVVIAAVLGTTFLGNAFQASNSVSNVLFELLAAGALSAVLVPTFVARLSRGDQHRAEEVAGGLLSLAWVGLGVVTILGVLAAPWIAELLTTGVDDAEVAADQQALTTNLLRFFIPQVLLYALGAVTTAVLHAKGRFALTAIAPVGNTIVLVIAMLAFRGLAGPAPGLDLDGGEQLVLALGGTLGVAAFVAVPAIGLRRSGFRLRLGARRAYRDPEVRSVLGLSGWAALQHTGTGILLAAALIAGGAVAGGVVAYQFAMVVFLAPYGIVAQPIHTAVLPQLAAEAQRHDRTGLRTSVRWAADAMVVATMPVAALLTALSAPVMAVLAFGQAAEAGGPELLGASLVGLALGVPAYGGFLLLTRVSYALGNSRTPAVASVVVAVLGAAGMLGAAASTDGSDTMVLIGLAHTLAYTLGAIALAARLRGEVGWAWHPGQLVPTVVAVAAGGLAWLAMEVWSPEGRVATIIATAVLGGLGMTAYAGVLRLLRALPPSGPVAAQVMPR